MIPLWLAVTLPVTEAICAGWLIRRFGLGRYPALIVYLLTESLWHSLAILDYQIATRVGAPFRIVTRLWITAEVFRLAREWNLPEAVKTGSASIAGMIAVTVGMERAIHLSPVQSFFAFRQYFYLGLCAALWALVIRSYRWPKLENKRTAGSTAAYRWGVAVWMSAIAIPGTFVKGGLGYLIFPRSDMTWGVVDISARASIVLVVVWLGLKLAAEPQKRAARIAGCSRRSNVTEFRRVA